LFEDYPWQAQPLPLLQVLLLLIQASPQALLVLHTLQHPPLLVLGLDVTAGELAGTVAWLLFEKDGRLFYAAGSMEGNEYIRKVEG
jgi:hypothetical protein